MNINVRQVIIISLVIIILSIFVLCIPWIILMIGGQFSSNPASPQITYSEFPICLEYEIEDRHFKVEDTLVCEFDGFGFDEGKGKFRKWKSYLKSGNTRITLFYYITKSAPYL